MERLLAEAQVLRLVTPATLRTEIRRHPNHRGAARLSALLDTTEPTRSELERRLAAIIRGAGLVGARFNSRVGRDRARDAHLQALGYAVLRFTWRQVIQEPLLVAARIAQVLAGR